MSVIGAVCAVIGAACAVVMAACVVWVCREWEKNR